MRIQSRPLNIGRGLAVAAALTLVGWGAASLPWRPHTPTAVVTRPATTAR